ncbi:MAG: sigma-E factor negative regulatory protein RseC [Cycloclasticus sp.]|jgi:sigma-E factor negative regulatory protein RseC|tara:strand:+ start:29176 stop:29619 length:444 start_codon:yes stop_codon:yes gene_type:complete
MIEETATVQNVNDHLIQVVTTQSASCHQCNEAESCSTSVLSKFFGNKTVELQLYSDLTLKAGDKVLLGIEESVFVGLTCLVYFLPLCALLLFALLGQAIESELNINNEVPTILLAITGFISCYYAIKASIQRYFKPERINPVILKKL